MYSQIMILGEPARQIVARAIKAGLVSYPTGNVILLEEQRAKQQAHRAKHQAYMQNWRAERAKKALERAGFEQINGEARP